MIKAVVFDWDGTLVDNMSLYYRAYKAAFEGVREIAPYDLYLREGGRAVDIVSDLAEGSGRDVDDILSEKRRNYELLSRGLEMLPEGRRLIKELKERKIKIGLATGTLRKNLSLIMSPQELALFDYIISGDVTEKPKPDPEPYLKCLKGLGVKPSEAVAVDNAPLGIESAKRAGMTTIAVESTLPEKYFAEADYKVKSLRDVGEVVKGLLKNVK